MLNYDLAYFVVGKLCVHMVKERCEECTFSRHSAFKNSEWCLYVFVLWPTTKTSCKL